MKKRLDYLSSQLVLGLVAVLSGALLSEHAHAQTTANFVDYPILGRHYAQNFDNSTATNPNPPGLAQTGAGQTQMPAGWGFVESTGNTQYEISPGGATTPNTYSYGNSGTVPERAFGTLRNGAVSGFNSTLGVAFRNTTGQSITQVELVYQGEQWRLSSNAVGRTADRLDFQYSTDATSLSSGTWTDVDPLDFSSPTLTGTVGALAGNSHTTRLSQTITITIPNNGYIFFRWLDFDNGTANDGLAIDDVSVLMRNATQTGTTIPYTSAGGVYSQNFDNLGSNTNRPGLANIGLNSVLPPGWRISESGANANTTYATDFGTTATGNTYSFGGSSTATSDDRALGGLSSGSLTPRYGAVFVNSTGAKLTHISISYQGELWRTGTANRQDRLAFAYQIQGTDLSTGTFTPVTNLDYVASSATTGTKDGNQNQTLVTHTIAGLNWDAGQTLVLRWTDTTATSDNDSLAIDDFSFTASAATAVELMDFKALAVSGGVWLKWKTGLEVDNVGFNVYRQRKRDDGTWGPKIKLNPALIASATLLTNPRVDTNGGYLYGWPDENPGDLRRFRYFLEDVDTLGKVTTHDPVRVQPGSGSLATRISSPLITDLGG